MKQAISRKSWEEKLKRQILVQKTILQDVGGKISISPGEIRAYYDAHMEDDADTLLIAYGVTARAAKEACIEQKSEGNPVSLLVPKTIWPVPENLIKEKAKNVKRVVMVEMNTGQYVREIERVLPDKQIDFFGQMNGKLITPRQIKEVIAHV